MPRLAYGLPSLFSPSFDHTAQARSPSTIISSTVKVRRGYFRKRTLKKRRIFLFPWMVPVPGKSKTASSARHSSNRESSRLFMAVKRMWTKSLINVSIFQSIKQKTLLGYPSSFMPFYRAVREPPLHHAGDCFHPPPTSKHW